MAALEGDDVRADPGVTRNGQSRGQRQKVEDSGEGEGGALERPEPWGWGRQSSTQILPRQI